jgi:SPP1 family predicted phage head-tail adaptor
MIKGPQQLNKRIELQRKTSVSDGMGNFTDTWATYATVWARKTTHRSDDAVQAMQTTGIAIHNFRIRYRAGVLSSDRIKDGTSYMAIIGPPIEVDNGGADHWTDLTVKEAT